MVTSHPLYSEFQFLPSGSRLRFPSVRSNRYKHSFIPTWISLLNLGMQGVGGRKFFGFCVGTVCVLILVLICEGTF